MKILNVIDLMNPIFGGSEERSFQMSQHLGASGDTVDLLTTSWCLDQEWIGELKSGNIFVVRAFFFRYLFPLGATKWLDENISNYDIVHISKNWSILAYQASKAAKKHNIPYVFSAMGFVSIHNRSRVLKSLYKRYVSIPMIIDAAACISVTKEEKLDLLAVGAQAEKIHVIPNGIIPEDFLVKDESSFKKKYGLDGKKIILFIGRMDPIKGVHLLISAFSNLSETKKDWCLVLVGTKTAYRKKMEHKVATLKLNKKIRFLNPIFGDEKSIAYNASEFVVVPSVKDAMTIVAPEAACCSKPVLITSTSDFSGLSQNGGGLEVPPTVEGLTKGLDYMMSDDTDLSEMGERAHQYVLKNFNWKVVAGRFRALFKAVLRV